MDARNLFNVVSRLNGHEGTIMWVRIILGTFLVLAAVCAAAAGAVEPGLQAPRFELQSIEGGFIDSQELFASKDLTFLVFWSSQCSHCVESLHGCEAFHGEYGGGSIQVVGMNTDEGGSLRLQEVLEIAGVSFLQLWDGGGAVAGEYEVPYETFALDLVD